MIARLDEDQFANLAHVEATIRLALSQEDFAYLVAGTDLDHPDNADAERFVIENVEEVFTAFEDATICALSNDGETEPSDLAHVEASDISDVFAPSLPGGVKARWSAFTSLGLYGLDVREYVGVNSTLQQTCDITLAVAATQLADKFAAMLVDALGDDQ